MTRAGTSPAPTVLLDKNLAQCRKQKLIFRGRADAQAEIVREHRIIAHVAYENVAAEKLRKYAARLKCGADDHKVGARRHGRESLDALQLSKQPLALRYYALDERSQFRLVHFNSDLSSRLRNGVEVVRQHGLADFPREFRRGQQVAYAQGSHRHRLREGAQDHKIRVTLKQWHNRLPRKLVVGFIHDDESL